MSAKEMFKEAGYKLDKQATYLIYWKVAEQQRINAYYNRNEVQIEFNLYYKTIEKRELMNLDENSNIITIEEWKAINKQVEELGWDK